MRGSLDEGILPGLMRELYVGRKSGVLVFRRGDERRGVRFRAGNIVHGDTNVREDRLGEVLVRLGRFSEAELKRATGFALRDRRRLGLILVDLGILAAAELEDALALHVHAVLSKVFAWSEGSFEFTPEDGSETGEGDVTLKVSTGDLILQAARSVSDPDVVRYCLGDIDRILGLSPDPLLRFQRVALTPSDGYVLSRVDGSLSTRELIAMTPLPAEDVQRSLFGLLSIGMVEYLSLPPKAPLEGAAPADPTSRAGALPDAGMAPTLPGAPNPAALPAGEPDRVPDAVRPPMADAADAADDDRELVVLDALDAPEAPAEAPSPDPRRLEILEAHAKLADRTHFELLGVTRDATDAQVKEAYFRLAKRFHPDVHHDPALADLRDQIEAVFVALGEAYEVLRNPRIRARYESQLHPAPKAGAGAAPPDRERDAQQARDAIERGAARMAEGKHWEAIRILEPAVLRAAGPARQEARVLLARAYMKNVNWVKQGEELLRAVIAEDAQNVEACLLLGQVYRDQGLRSRAVAVLRKAVQLAPQRPEAREALAALGDDGAGAGGLLKKLFNRR
jgi:tetratricopeptide (TPR) repeat protein